MKKHLIVNKNYKHMKKLVILFCTFLFSLVSCQKTFLDLDDLDSVTEVVYFDTPQDFIDASNYFYRGLHSHQTVDGSGFDMISDFGTELSAYVQDYGQGTNTISNADIYWRNGYNYLRKINLLLDKAKEYPGDPAGIKESVATANFFRAYEYFKLLQRFGGVPIVTETTYVDSEILLAQRNSRYEVVAQILTDLDLAIASLPTTATGANTGKISKYAAIAFKSRVLLYEGTWEKYVGTTTDFEGSGTGNNSAAYIAEAVTSAKLVIDNGGYEIWNKNAQLNNLSYRWLFVLEDAKSNPGGFTKATNKEFIIQSVFDFALKPAGGNFVQITFGRNSPTQKALDMFSTLDGLPINKSSQFQGYVKQSDQFKNRDYRMVSDFGEQVLANGSQPITALGGASLTNLSSQKFKTYNNYRATGTEGFNYPTLRYAEVLLTFAEALYEKDNTISDANLNISVNLVRARAGIAPLTNALVTANGLNMLDEIRRERTVELYMENNNHWNDLKRWGTAEKELADDLIGYVIGGTEYETNPALFNTTFAKFGFKNDYPSGKGPVKAMIIDPKSARQFSRKNYLWPIPSGQRLLNPNLKQNPGWN
ncbi:hypothetical protein ADIARSV_2207 [Arcticibacter svalbardensis MN12-7]|uniref:Outer membrane protein n=1 Tax=Arcticibacter svalbardensis MN12-7 TaxID=1150600 RepID=R9H063_9SPHI|nr:RagB/SusD family nutrient uptake outer membrane protein [Arcticibacter svalbardensis]EOR94609.1 hypothetical protein ADIARSV_2207 [Arcticibacter svalbardensis MN12-7]